MARRRSGAPDVVDLILEQWARHDPELDPSAMAVFGRLHRSFLRYQAQLAPVFAGTASRCRRSTCWLRCGAAGALPQDDGRPHRHHAGDVGGISQRVDRLERPGLVLREKDADDGEWCTCAHRAGP